MAFDPDKFIKETAPRLVSKAAESGQFDPDKFLSETTDKPETFESKYLEPNVYPVGQAAAKALDIAATPLQWAVSVPLTAASATQKMMTGQSTEDVPNPFIHPLKAASEYGSTEALLKEIPGMDQPIAPGFSLEQAPKLGKALSQVTPAQAISPITDWAMMTGTTSLLGKTGLPEKLASIASESRARSLIKNSALPAVEENRLLRGGALQRIGDSLKEFGVEHLLKDPVKLKDALDGTYIQAPDPMTGVLKDTKVKPGLLDIEGQKLEALKNAADPVMPKFPKKTIIDKVVDAISSSKKRSILPGGWGAADVQDLSKEVNSLVHDLPDDMSLSDLVRLKRAIQDSAMLTEDQMKALTNKAPNFAEITKGFWHEIDGIVNQAASAYPEVRDYVQYNQKWSDLKKASDILKDVRISAAHAPSLLEGYSIMKAGESAGIPFSGREARSAVSYRSKSIPAVKADITQGLSDILSSPMQNLEYTGIPAMSAQRNKFMQNIHQDQPMNVQPMDLTQPERAPQSVITPLQAEAMKRGLVENLADYEIPRSASEILANKQMVLAKVAQSTNNIAVVNLLDDALNKHPDKLGAVLPALIGNPALHNLFRINKYQSWVDGKILDPMERQKAYQDVSNNASLSNTQKALLQNGLNKDGSFPEDM